MTKQEKIKLLGEITLKLYIARLNDKDTVKLSQEQLALMKELANAI